MPPISFYFNSASQQIGNLRWTLTRTNEVLETMQSLSWFLSHEATKSTITPPPLTLDGMLVYRCVILSMHLHTRLERDSVEKRLMSKGRDTVRYSIMPQHSLQMTCLFFVCTSCKYRIKLPYKLWFQAINSIRSVRENLDLGHEYRPHCILSALMTLVKILSYTPPARLTRAKYYYYCETSIKPSAPVGHK